MNKPIYFVRTAALWLLALGLMSVVVLVMTSSASAAEEPIESVTLSPSSNKYLLDAGSVKNDELIVLNDGNVAYDFIVYARPYSVKGQTYDPNFTETPTNADAYRWVQFEKTSWRIEPRETLKIPFTLRVPADATPGGHYGVIFVETQPKAGENEAVVRKKRVGSIIYATVNGTYVTGGQHLITDIPFLQFRAPLTATTTVENTGNADFDARVRYKVTDLFGGLKYEVNAPYVVLPKTIRKIPLEWQQAPWFGLFQVSVTTEYLDQSSEHRQLVLIAPRWVLLVVVGLLLGGGVYVALRRIRR